MQDFLRTIARENYGQSGYITHPKREGGTRYGFSAPPRSRFLRTDAVLGALYRREQARARAEARAQPTFLKSLFHALVRR